MITIFNYQIADTGSDLHIKQRNVLQQGDLLHVILRPVQNEFLARSLQKFFLDEFIGNGQENDTTIEQTILQTISAHNISALNFLGNPQDAPLSGAMLLVVYVAKDNTATIAQLGDFTIYHLDNTEPVKVSFNHTFDNLHERKWMLKSDLLQGSSNVEQDPTELIRQIAHDIQTPNAQRLSAEELYRATPSRFIGHPHWCGWGQGYGFGLINTEPEFIDTKRSADAR